MNHRIEGSKAAVLGAALGGVTAMEAKVQAFQQQAAQLAAERDRLAAALHAEIEAAVGCPVPAPMRLAMDGDAIVVSWEDGAA